ncbi:uncharacterized protein LOC18099670 isoform X5 [Populus trichocarpa]|uniref:uncharacterized protein LOC18099670 isoform X5 n=1 Tax=Populus trichocarpa TaxID=3694 RepID=UPI0022798C14|nr:uncharacterized protein LOC18099670 isoform X5 [Populus trichocarpa]
MTALIQVYDLETSYLQDPGQCGNVLKGFEGFLSSSKNTALLKNKQLDEMVSHIKLQNFVFLFCFIKFFQISLFIVDGRSEFGVGRSKGGGIYANGQGKPKKGRGASRDSKRIRPSADPDFDYDDDADLTL